MRVDRELTILGSEREAKKARAALEFDSYSPIEPLDLLRRIQASWAKSVKSDQVLHRIIVLEVRDADLNQPPKKFVPMRTATTKSVQVVYATTKFVQAGDHGLYVILLSSSIMECLTKGNPFGKSTLSHEFFHIWQHAHRQLLEKIGRFYARAEAGDRPAGQQLHDILTNRNHEAKFDCDSQANALAAAFSMPAEGLQYLETISTNKLSASGIARYFQVSEKSATIRLENYNEHKATLLGDPLRYNASTHTTVLRASRATSETGASENFVKSQNA